MRPLLPQDDPRADKRRAELASTQDSLRYAYDMPVGVATAEELPKGYGYPAGVVAKVAELTVILKANRAAHRIGEGLHAPDDSDPSTVQSCRDLFATIGSPLIEPVSLGPDADRLFGWQRLGGPNPMQLRRIEALPDHFPVPDEVFRGVTGSSFAAAAAEGKVYLVDHTELIGIPGGKGAGRDKIVVAPMALFALVGGQLAPVAIQCGQDPAVGIVTPADGVRWTMARATVAAADLNVQENFWHLGRCHFLLEAFALAFERQIAKSHPLRPLLEPHFEGTLPINNAAKTELIAPGGQLEQLLAPSLEGSLTLVTNGLKSWSAASMALPQALADRGVDDPELLPHYPFRDDGLRIWHAIAAFANAYVRQYYDDAAVGADVELQAFVRELSSEDGGRLDTPATVDDVAGLVELLTLIMWSASAQHAVVNYSQYDFMGFAPSMGCAAYAGIPGAETSEDAAWQAMLPPRSLCAEQVDFMYQQSQVRNNRLGKYGFAHFKDPAVHDAVAGFQAALSDAEDAIAAANATRPLPYTYLLPSLLTASIHI